MSRLRRADWFYVTAVLLLAAGLRLVGLDFGQPDYAYAPSDAPTLRLPRETPVHPDEYFFVGIPFQMAVTKYPNPRFFENPNFLIYLNFFTYLATGSTTGISQEERAEVGQREYAPFPAYLIGRVYSALGGVLAVALTYAVTHRLAGRFAAAAGTLLAAASFTLAQHGHYATPSSLSAAFVMLCLWTSLISLSGKAPRPWAFALAGVAAGLAATTRYNAAGASIVVFLAGLALLYRHRNRQTLWIVLAGWALFPLLFVLGTPGILFDFPKFWQDFTRIFTQFLTTGYGFSANYLTDPWLSLWFHLRYLALFSLGLPATAAAVLGMVAAVRRQQTRLFAAIVLVFLLTYTLIVLRNVRPSYNDHMLVPVIPVLAVFAGIGAAWVVRLAPLPPKLLRPALTLMLVVVTLGPAVQVTHLFQQRDTRYRVQVWVYEHLPRGANVHLVGPYNVPLDPAEYVVTQTFIDDFTPPATFVSRGVDYVILSDAWLWDVQRSVEFMPASFVARVRDYYARFDRALTPVARIERPLWTGSDWLMHTASYWHHPGLRVYCLNAEACTAVR